jgi:transposase InsO family protein
LQHDFNILLSQSRLSQGNSQGDFFSNKIRRVTLPESVTVPDFSLKIVEISLLLNESHWNLFEAVPMTTGLIFNLIFPGEITKLSILIYNGTDCPLTLPADLVLGFVIPVYIDSVGFEADTGKSAGRTGDNTGKFDLDENGAGVVSSEVGVGPIAPSEVGIISAKNSFKVGNMFSESVSCSETGINDMCGVFSPHVRTNSVDCDPSGQATSIKSLTDFVLADCGDCYPASDSDNFLALKSNLPEHLRDLFQRSVAHLSFFQAFDLAKLLENYSETFSTGDVDLGQFSQVQHRIHLSDNKAIKQKLRPTPFHFQKEEASHLENMIKAGIVRPSSSEWASPVCLVRKKDGGVRWCIDYRRLNEVTIKDAFPLPRIGECLDTLSGSVWFSSIDMASGYWQVEVAEEDRHKTAFLSKYGLFEHVRMPFGLSNAPATFQRVIQVVLRGLLWDKALAYLDDVMVLGVDVPTALSNLDLVLARFKLYNLKLKPKKCFLMQKQTDFLGHTVSAEGVSVKPAHLETMTDWPIPKTLQQLQSFLGFASYHRDYLPKYAHISDPLYKLVRDSRPGDIALSEAQIEIIKRLKLMLATAPVLVYPDPDRYFILDTDASDTAIGGELLQYFDGEERAITYSSYALTAAQRKYCTTRKELLAVIRFTRQFRHYLLGRRFVVRTDHNSLVWLMGFKNIEGQLARWLEELAQYDMVLLHRPGKEHLNADALSRIPDNLNQCANYDGEIPVYDLPCHPCAYCQRADKQWARFGEDIDYVKPLAVRTLRVNLVTPDTQQVSNWVPNYSPQELKEKQRNDSELSVVIRWLTGDAPTQAELAISGLAEKHYWRMRDQLEFRDGVLFYRWEDVLEPRYLLVVPYDLRTDVLCLAHDAKSAGHMGRNNTYHTLKQSFFWHRMYDDVAKYIATCARCSMNKKPNKTRKAAFVQYHCGSPMERVHIDILGPFSVSNSGNNYVLMMVDQFTKWLECCALPDQSAEKIADKAVTEFFVRFGFPSIIHTDQGANFTGQVFTSLCRMLEITKTRTTAYRPQSNGQVERFNRTLVEMIRCLLSKNIKDWDKFLPHVASAIRCIQNKGTGFSANRLMLGRELVRPVEILYGVQPVNPHEGEGEYLRKLDSVLREAHKLAQKHLNGGLQRQKRDYDTNLKVEEYQVGDLVYKLRSGLKKGISRKLLSVFEGPYLITRVISSILFKIEGRKRSFVVHHDKIRPCLDRFIPMWIRRRRQEILDLDETIAYDAQEQSLLDLSDDFTRLYGQVDNQPGSATAAETVNNQASSDDSSNNLSDSRAAVSGEGDEESDEDDLSPISTTYVSRTGRVIRPNPRFRDYV